MPLVLAGATSGSITIDVPATAGTNTLTIPASTGTVITTTSPKAGNVIQVVNVTYTTTTSTTSTSFVDTGLTASITPSSSSSKILVIATVNGVGKDGGTQIAFRLVRGSTTISNYESSATYTATIANNFVGSCGVEYLDSPSTTSSTTYKVQFKSVAGATIYAQSAGAGDGSASSITLMEIAA